MLAGRLVVGHETRIHLRSAAAQLSDAKPQRVETPF